MCDNTSGIKQQFTTKQRGPGRYNKYRQKWFWADNALSLPFSSSKTFPQWECESLTVEEIHTVGGKGTYSRNWHMRCAPSGRETTRTVCTRAKATAPQRCSPGEALTQPVPYGTHMPTSQLGNERNCHTQRGGGPGMSVDKTRQTDTSCFNKAKMQN